MSQTATKLEPARKMLSFENVELYYDHVYALKGVSIDLMEGETVALIGANGAGKSSRRQKSSSAASRWFLKAAASSR